MQSVEDSTFELKIYNLIILAITTNDFLKELRTSLQMCEQE